MLAGPQPFIMKLVGAAARAGKVIARPRYWLQLVVLFALYVFTGKLGLKMDAVSGFATLVWPPTGIALAALTLYGVRLWPAATMGALVVNLISGAPVLVACGIATGNTLEAVAGVLLLRRWGFQLSLSRTEDALALIVLAAFLSTTISASLGTLSLWLGGVDPLVNAHATWGVWWAGDALGDLIVAPMLLVWSQKATWHRLCRNRLLETALFGCAVAVGGLLHFSSSAVTSLASIPQAYVIFPVIIWSALRFGVRPTITTVFFMSVAAIAFTTLGVGPFVKSSLRESLANLHFFMGTVSVTALILSSAVAERVHKDLLIRESEERARAEAKLRQSEQRYHHLVNATKDYAIFMLNPTGIIVSWNAGAAQMKGYADAEILGKHFSILYPEGAIKAHLPEHHLLKATEAGHFETEDWRVRKDGSKFWASTTITALSTDDDEIYGFSKITRDRTKERNAAEELRLAKRPRRPRISLRAPFSLT